MAIKKQKKAGISSKNVQKTVAKPVSLKVTGRKSKSAPAKKAATQKAKAGSAPTKKHAVKVKATPIPKKTDATKTTKSKVTKKPLVPKTVSSGVKAASSAKSVPASTNDNRFNKKDLDQFRAELLAMRERITGQSGAMRNAALQRNDEVNLEEEGTDAFIRLQTLAQVGTQQQIVASIDEALRAIEKSVYGICDACGSLIGKSRLKVLPFAKNCINCQSEIEQKRYHIGRR